MNEPLYAHTNDEKNNPKAWHSLGDHLRDTAKLAAEFAASFGSAPWGYALGILHDLGKVHPLFQKYLIDSTPERISAAGKSNDQPGDEASSRVDNRGGTGRMAKRHSPVNHSAAGAYWAKEQLGPFFGQTLAYPILGHHAGLPDYIGGVEPKSSLQFRLSNEVDDCRRCISTKNDEILSLLGEITTDALPLPETFEMSVDAYHLWVRMLFSCLTDADWLDTERYSDINRYQNRPTFPSLPELKARFDRYMNGIVGQETVDGTNGGTGTIKQIRDEIYRACLRAAQKKPGLFTLCAPTGGGKTLSSMAFALEHAVRHHKSRIIYAIPYTSIIEQTADVFRKIFGEGNVLEHHCNFDPARLDEKKDKTDLPFKETLTEEQYLQATENWDAPIIVTTNVQFFESCFAADPRRCRKLHNIVNSVVIFDEAQMLPTDLLSPCVHLLNQLSHAFGVTSVICTATQPALEQLKTIETPNIKYTPLDKTTPIIEEDVVCRHFKALKRVRYEFDHPDHPRSWEALAGELAGIGEVLCIVNTRRDCYDLFQALSAAIPEKEKGTVYHLSALQCGSHRMRLIGEIKDHLAQNREHRQKGEPIVPIRVVSTQLIEAGVDIDFPVVYRACAGLDSVAQAAGRCNREGKLPREGVVRVFTTANPIWGGVMRKGADTTAQMLKNKPDIDPNDPMLFLNFFRQFYNKLNTLDKDQVVEQLTKDVNNSSGDPEVPFRSVADQFQLIEDEAAYGVIVPYNDEARKLIKQLKFGIRRDLMRSLQRYTVTLRKNQLCEAIAGGIIREVYPGIFVQEMLGIYEDTVGMNIFRDTFPVEAVVI